MRIAILGTRGIPANYGGFETFAEELSKRLVVRGHEVTVYGRSRYVRHGLKEFEGVRLAVLPTLRTKHLDTVVHTFLSCLHAWRCAFDVVLMCNSANSFGCRILSLAGIPSVLNVDGIERERRKWGWAGRRYYRISEGLGVRWATCLVSDAEVIRHYYLERHRAESVTIPYGFNIPEQLPEEFLSEWKVQPREYYLFVSRLEPENNADVVIRAHCASGSSLPLLIVGDAPYAKRYIRGLKAQAGPLVRFCGSIYGPPYHALQARAHAYIQATEVGGTHPALVEAMGHGNMILANDTPENREVLSDTGLFYHRNDAGDLARVMGETEKDPGLRERLGQQARQRACQHYDWDKITLRYESVFEIAQARFRSRS